MTCIIRTKVALNRSSLVCEDQSVILRNGLTKTRDVFKAVSSTFLVELGATEPSIGSAAPEFRHRDRRIVNSSCARVFCEGRGISRRRRNRKFGMRRRESAYHWSGGVRQNWSQYFSLLLSDRYPIESLGSVSLSISGIRWH